MRKILGEVWLRPLNPSAIDTRFTKDTMDGLVLWLDAMDVDGDNLPDQNSDGGSLPLWIDKSKENKNTVQTVALQTPSYVTKAIELYRVYASSLGKAIMSAV